MSGLANLSKGDYAGPQNVAIAGIEQAIAGIGNVAYDHKDQIGAKLVYEAKEHPRAVASALGGIGNIIADVENDPYGFPIANGIPQVKEMQDGHILGSHDIVGTTFWIACAAMLAGTVFFFCERFTVPERWQQSVTVAGLVTGIAFWNYCYMRESWVLSQNSPTVYRYTDWLITVPLQIVEFYLILKAVLPNLSSGLFYRLLAQSVLMLAFGYAGESGIISVLAGFIPGCICWLGLVYEMFSGECSNLAKGCGNKAATKAFNALRLIISCGWAIYPLGYYLTLLGPTFTYHSQSVINITYNLADLVNKLAFGMCIWGAAVSDTSN